MDQLGDYELLRLVDETLHTQTYEARQASVDRTVALILLNPEFLDDPNAVEAFNQEIRAKASVTHARIASVYEARETDGQLYYTRELVVGRDLGALMHSGEKLPIGLALDLVESLCDAVQYFEQHGIARRALTLQDMLLVHDEPYLENFAVAEGSGTSSFHDDSLLLHRVLGKLLDAEEMRSVDVRAFLKRLNPAHGKAFATWAEVKRAAGMLRRIRATSAARKAKHSPVASVASARFSRRAVLGLGSLGLGGAVLWWLRGGSKRARALESLAEIPEGDFVYGDGEKGSLATFWISQYEVTIAAYAEFLKKADSGKMFDHLEQPPTKKDHVPDDWAVYYEVAQAGGFYRGNRLSLNCPVFAVDWWDAYAYAQWKGRRLATRQEWEKAARGLDGRAFPWGDEENFGKANWGVDYDQRAELGGRLDGYNGWAPVDAMPGDVSPLRVFGMAGNVLEWTADWEIDPEFPDKRVAVVMGGSFLSKTDLELGTRRFRDRGKRELGLGFRTAADR